MVTSILSQFREALERDMGHRQAVLDELRLSLSCTSESDGMKRHAFEVAILAGQRLLQASENRLRSLDEAMIRAKCL